ncbi:hypothetical protein BJX70DRAFT_241707 [Aspergillus crustosus]
MIYFNKGFVRIIWYLMFSGFLMRLHTSRYAMILAYHPQPGRLRVLFRFQSASYLSVPVRASCSRFGMYGHFMQSVSGRDICGVALAICILACCFVFAISSVLALSFFC